MAIMFPPQLFLLFLLLQHVEVHIAEKLIPKICPEKKMWNLRAADICDVADNYVCLYDTNDGEFRELCRKTPAFHRPGIVFVISGNFENFAARTCKENKYQPHIWWTNGSSECQYLKSTCNAEGLVPYDNGTITSDRKCRCDYTNFYAFVGNKSNKCYCEPVKEDCSCYRKRCKKDHVLTPDYDCLSIYKWTGGFVCPEYKIPKISDENQLPVKCPTIKKDFTSAPKQLRAPIPHILIAVVIGILECTDKNKIRLLKNYQRIKDSIVPLDIIKNIPHSARDLDEFNSLFTQTQRINKILEMLMKSDRIGYRQFLTALKTDNVLKTLADDIETTKVSENELLDDFNFLFEDPVPANIRSIHNMIINDWNKNSETNIVYTDAILNLYSSLETADVVTVLGPRKCGKSSTLHAVALFLLELDFEIVPCTSPAEMVNYHSNFRNQAFLFDDFCGTTTARLSFITQWNDKVKIIERILRSSAEFGKKKLLFSSDIILFNTVRGQIPDSSIFTKNIFHMLSEDNKLSVANAKEIGLKYGINNNDIYELSSELFFYPQLCSKSASFVEEKHIDHIRSLVYEIINDLLTDLTKNDPVLLATLSLFVIKGNQITLPSDSIQNILHDISEVLETSTGTLSVSAINQTLNILIGSYVYVSKSSDTYTCYTVTNTEIFTGIVSFFNSHHFNFLLKVSPPEILRTRFQFENGYTCIQCQNIKVPLSKETAYFNKLFRCIRKEKEDLSVAFRNKQLENADYRNKFISYIISNYEVKQFLKSLSNQNVRRDSPLIMLLEGEYIDIFEALVNEKICIDVSNIEKMTPLSWAIKNKNRDIVQYMLKKYCDPNACGTNLSMTPLLVAIKENGDEQIVKMLLKNGANPNACGLDKKTPLFFSVRKGQTKIVCLLLQYNADPAMCDLSDNSPLHIASEFNDKSNVDILEMLLENMKMNGHDLNICNSMGKTPLLVAVEQRAVQHIELLLKHGADQTIRDKSNRSPADIAKINGFNEIVRLLK
ncbi:unnamed protein product [Mytilus coruscus]|uniref:Novel STAND NTPase 3 domain-containing protein n=1 Tax=Mytilus coruscus TaxID=42192 RepID=A0A6J8EN00_MYTCO|nr:unnamed protein product [Mytilus coruscus]